MGGGGLWGTETRVVNGEADKLFTTKLAPGGKESDCLCPVLIASLSPGPPKGGVFHRSH